MPNKDSAELREQIWKTLGRRNEKIVAAQKTNTLVVPYFKADDEAADEIITLMEAHTAAQVVAAHSKYSNIVMVLERAEQHGNDLDLTQIQELLSALNDQRDPDHQTYGNHVIPNDWKKHQNVHIWFGALAKQHSRSWKSTLGYVYEKPNGLYVAPFKGELLSVIRDTKNEFREQ